jgi:hypothetical protein
VNQYFQAQAGITINFVPSGDPSATATLNFVNNSDSPSEMCPLCAGVTLTAPIGSFPISYVNTQFLAEQMAFNPNGSYFQGVLYATDHELTHALTGGQVGDSDTGLMSSFDPETGFGSDTTADLEPDEVQQLQEDNCNNEGDFGGNQGPMDPGSPDQPAVAKSRRHF